LPIRPWHGLFLLTEEHFKHTYASILYIK